MDLSIEGLGGKGRKFGKGKVQIESDEVASFVLRFGNSFPLLWRKFFGEKSLEIWNRIDRRIFK